MALAAILVAAACGADDGPTAVDEVDSVADSVAPTTQLIIESWRTEDQAAWEASILPAFEARYPSIDVTFLPTPAVDYDRVLVDRFERGQAGDVITCRPFDRSLELYEAGHLEPVTDLPGLEVFSDISRTAWTTDDGTTTFCIPVASVMHGFMYNTAIFNELGLTPPDTVDEFDAVLEAIAVDGRYIPLALGLADMWESATVGFQNIGPTYWGGESGRQALLDGSGSFTDEGYVAALDELASWRPYLPEAAAALSYEQAKRLFEFGEAAIYPTGSWELGEFDGFEGLDYGAFAPPRLAPDEPCQVTDHTDLGIGVNPNSANAREARLFLEWTTTVEFAELYGEATPGFLSLHPDSPPPAHPVAVEFASWRDECETTIRNSAQILSRGEPDLEAELWRVSSSVMSDTLDPVDAARQLDDGLRNWYEPTR